MEYEMEKQVMEQCMTWWLFAYMEGFDLMGNNKAA